MLKLDLEEPEIKLPTYIGSWRKQESSRKTSTSALLTIAKPLTVWITTNFGKYFKRWEHQTTYLPPEKSVCRSRSNSYNQIWNNRLAQIEKWVRQGYILSNCLFNLYVEYIMRNAKLDEAQNGIKIAGRNINNLRYADDTTLTAESKEELKASWWKWKRRLKMLA